MTKAAERVLDRVGLNPGDGVRRVEDPADVGHLEARAEKTRARVLRALE